ncbi:vam6/Vps39-like protein [Cinnamomum micranthum f. kanehirae]|uniref:Vam6/Vps39-like protein n=1 Tax=Cinnamomum micranthum f. kanehirae TaxID=337451 RepID=A0A3S3NN99_9MAGN|nr:vam6/Vps39-like protein [Cinnamomum micranthum f. kanehirae]
MSLSLLEVDNIESRHGSSNHRLPANDWLRREEKARVLRTLRSLSLHNAYDAIELVKNRPTKIESIASNGSKLHLACVDGSLRIYAPQSAPSSPSDPSSNGSIQRRPYVLEKNLGSFSRKPIVAMEISKSTNLLLSLSETITFHRLPNLELVAAVSKSKGANAYAWDDRRGVLCFGRQKRVGIFRLEVLGSKDFGVFEEGRFGKLCLSVNSLRFRANGWSVEVKEFSIPDMVKSIAWCGENICLGIRREYMILNSPSGVLSEVFPSGRVAPPLVVPLPSGELLLGKDNIGVVVDQNGKLNNDGRICWSEAPASVVIHILYAIARLPRYVEIRSLKAPYPLVQTVALRDVHLLFQSNNCVIAALENSVYGLLAAPLGAQVGLLSQVMRILVIFVYDFRGGCACGQN